MLDTKGRPNAGFVADRSCANCDHFKGNNPFMGGGSPYVGTCNLKGEATRRNLVCDDFKPRAKPTQRAKHKKLVRKKLIVQVPKERVNDEWVLIAQSCLSPVFSRSTYRSMETVIRTHQELMRTHVKGQEIARDRMKAVVERMLPPRPVGRVETDMERGRRETIENVLRLIGNLEAEQPEPPLQYRGVQDEGA